MQFGLLDLDLLYLSLLQEERDYITVYLYYISAIFIRLRTAVVKCRITCMILLDYHNTKSCTLIADAELREASQPTSKQPSKRSKRPVGTGKGANSLFV